ncbi:retrovirus-related pol polyprotein from transposon TNT 1-94 [Tanacetum coccineum]|uniref:Retrovirus-related pol polyprotein from transposon TNT 1-94 n=1 Tax=Tanacetum coccineum TaxID=301880 RepID=A0ABQ5ADC5_9ASTR
MAGYRIRPPIWKGPYEFKEFVPKGSTISRLQSIEDLKGDDLLLHDAEMEVMNMILLSILNEIYNSVDACTSAKDMWKRVELGLRILQPTPNQAIIQGDRVNIQSRNSGNTGRNSRRAYVQEEVVEGNENTQRDSKMFKDSFEFHLQRIEKLARNAYQEAEKQRLFAQQVQTQNTHLTSQLAMYKERVWILENINKDNNYLNEFLEADERAKRYNKQAQSQLVRDRDIIRDLEKQRDKLNLEVKNFKRKNEELQKTHSILKRQMSEKEDTYHDTILDLEAKLKKNVDLILKLSNSLQGMFMLGSKPLSNLFQMDIKEMKDVFESTESELDEQEKQNDLLKDQLLEASLKHDKTYAYGAIRAESKDLLSTISELKTRLEKVEKGKSVNTKFDKTNASQTLLYVTPLNKHAFQKKTDVSKTEENHVVSKPVTLQTSSTKQTGTNQNKNVIKPGMYRVVTTQESQTNKTKSALSSTGMNATSRVRRPMSRDSHVAHSVLDNSKKAAKNVSVYVRKNKQKDNTSANVISNKENVIDVDVANASKAKTLLCVSCMQNVLIPCHDKCLAKHKLNVRSNVRRTFSTNSRKTPKSYNSYVAPKTRFSKKETQSKTLDTTSVVSKSKIDVESASKAKDKVVQIVLWIVDSGCSKHMTGDRSLLRNFNKKFMGTVRFGNDNFAAITCYGDYIQGNITIYHVYYVEGLGHNLFSVGQFCDGDLEVAFRSKTCYVRNLEGDDLLTGGRESNLYTISISDMAASSPVCLMSKATSTKLWLWHRRLSHLNFGTINDLTRLDLVDGLPKFKYEKDHLLDDYSRYTWVYFLHSKDETPEIIKKFIAQAQLNYKAKVCKIHTDNGTEFKNATLKAHYEKLGIMQQFSTARTPQQNGVVERRNRTLVEAARTMLIFSRLPEFLWADAVATSCFTQNRSIIHTRYNKTPYEILRG